LVDLFETETYLKHSRTSLKGIMPTNVQTVNYLKQVLCAMSDRCCYCLLFITDSVTSFCNLEFCISSKIWE